MSEAVRAESAQVGMTGSISPDVLQRLAAASTDTPRLRVSMDAIRKAGLHAAAINQDAVIATPHTFSHEIPTGGITNQKRTGRCWMFAGLNVLRLSVMARCGISDFELSQAYPMFWDKLERANHFLESILETLEEPRDGRLVAWLLDTPVQDGGQWDMFVNLLDKYGAVPKGVMPETFHSSDSGVMNRMLVAKLREHAADLRAAYGGGATPADLRGRKEGMLADVHGMLIRFLGRPPERFDFEYRDRDKGFHRDPGLSPREFVRKYGGDYAAGVSLIHAPTADKPFGRTYTVQFLGNVRGGRDVLYLNLPVGRLKEFALAQITDGVAVWFGCDVGKMSDRESGVMDPGLYDYDAALGVGFGLDKAGRLDYGESRMTHAMVLTGVHVVDGRPVRWKVENSWGKESGREGFYVMSDAWFDQYLYQVVVDRKYLPADLRAALAQPPVRLPPWDPMGALARG